MTKQELRTQIKEALKTAAKIDPAKVVQRISALPEYKGAKYIFGYIPMPMEVDITLLMDKAVEDGKTIAFPDKEIGVFRVGDRNWRQHLITLENKTKTLSEGDTLDILNILTSNVTIAPSEKLKGLILVPGLAFTEFGTRLGRGAGYYDQLLSVVEKSTIADIISIGICKQVQLVKNIPQQPHDKNVRMVIAF